MTIAEYIQTPAFRQNYEAKKRTHGANYPLEAFIQESIEAADRTFGANGWNRPTDFTGGVEAGMGGLAVGPGAQAFSAQQAGGAAAPTSMLQAAPAASFDELVSGMRAGASGPGSQMSPSDTARFDRLTSRLAVGPGASTPNPNATSPTPLAQPPIAASAAPGAASRAPATSNPQTPPIAASDDLVDNPQAENQGGGLGAPAGPTSLIDQIGQIGQQFGAANPSAQPQDGQRNLQQEAASMFQAQLGIAPYALQAYQALGPQYTQSNINNMGSAMFGPGWTGSLTDANAQLTNFANQQTQGSNAALRDANIADVDRLGGAAMQQRFNLNPALYQGMDALDAASRQSVTGGPAQGQLQNTFAQGPQMERVQGYSVNPNYVGSPTINPSSVGAPRNSLLNIASGRAASGGGTSMLGGDLTSMARDQLALGGQATPWELQQAEQQAREAWSARGLVNSPGAVGAEIINRDDLQRQRLLERQNFASGVEQMNQGGLLSLIGATANQGALGLQAGMANQQNQYQSQLATGQLGQNAALANQDQSFRSQLATGQAGQAAQASNQGAGLQAQSLNQQLGMNLANLGTQQQQAGFGNQLAASQMRAQTAFDPNSVLWNSPNAGTNSQLTGQGAAAAAGALGDQSVMSMLSPFNAYGSDLFNTNLNAQSAANISRRNNNAALIGAGAGLFGDLFDWEDWYGEGGFFGTSGSSGGGQQGNQTIYVNQDDWTPLPGNVVWNG